MRLPPRSALKVVPPRVTPRLLHGLHAPAYSSVLTSKANPAPPPVKVRGGEGGGFCRTDGEVSVACLSAIHFRGQFIRQVSCYTLLSGCQLPWPPTCCLDELTLLMGSAEQAFRHLNLTFGSSHIAIPAYQEWPMRDLHHWTTGSLKREGGKPLPPLLKKPVVSHLFKV